VSLTLRSSISELEEYMRSLDDDANVTPVEFQLLRDSADNKFEGLSTVDVKAFQSAADTVVETMQKLAIAARKAKLSPEERKKLAEGIEFQLGYVIAGYQSSIQRL